MLSHLSLLLIHGYQQVLSPRKGYGCAYRLAYGGTGCSGFATLRIREVGLIAALPAIRDRFRACKAAAVALGRDEEDDNKKHKTRWYDYCDACSCCGSGNMPGCGRPRGGGDGCDGTPDCTPDCCGP
ncbi:membrane protein insertion efficiency factor YidD [Thalassococcus sp. S3]|uniref:membrane protein insertion efficiency factor YidD n=1 Tax=Thalassococcus sp. S3 TaxID=2017482 RepID=UPI0010244F12|nr:membrane protein insertion efficiency factor YidD [Thalassococcus sp. S3]QBF31055.1 hypothetical protein CFI11_07455 [Thalassococcus sp. S3]